MISVIITAYKTQDFLEDCLDNVIAQDYKGEYEVLLGIDGCADTLREFENWSKSNDGVSAYMMDKNVGTYVTSNTLVSLAKGDYILRFDSDDVMLPFMLTEFSKNLGDNILCEFPAVQIKGNKMTINRVMHGCTGYSKKLFYEIGGYKDWRCAADTDFMQRAVANNAIRVMVSRPTFLRRIHRDSLTQSPETRFGSPLRREYKKMLGKQKTTEPATATFKQVS